MTREPSVNLKPKCHLGALCWVTSEVLRGRQTPRVEEDDNLQKGSYLGLEVSTCEPHLWVKYYKPR